MLVYNITDVNMKNSDGNTALMLATLEGHIDVVRILLDKGADPTISNNERHTHSQGSEHRKERQGDTNTHTKNLSDVFSSIKNKFHKDGNTALMLATLEGHIDVVRILLDKGADPTISNNERHTHSQGSEHRKIFFIFFLFFWRDRETQTHTQKMGIQHLC
eukprot:GHVR01008440.1.p1 GENE.GHVR01008440.1~~GHVR01008440.1.p1  ORF type:complete len:161 (-),score=54.49 GHVR01008440.1:75-557(-)